MEPRVVLLTGGNSGIGFEAASGLTRAGWRVVIASRNRAASAEAVGDFDVLAATGGPDPDLFDGRLADVNSKRCSVWFAYELDRRLWEWAFTSSAKRIRVNGWEPGLVPGSGLARDYPPAARLVWNWVLPGVTRVLHPFLPGVSTLRLSGRALARMVLDPALAGVSGKCFPATARWREAPSSRLSYDAERARELGEASARMTNLSPNESRLVSRG